MRSPLLLATAAAVVTTLGLAATLGSACSSYDETDAEIPPPDAGLDGSNQPEPARACTTNVDCAPLSVPEVVASDTEDAGTFSPPGGELPATDAAVCAGACSGAGTCSFPGPETTCGPSFCGSQTQQARATCDGKGHCVYSAPETCVGYTCPSDAAGCLSACKSNSDCQDGFHCSDGRCAASLALGTVCSSPAQCASGFCSSGVCCSSECTGAGLGCNAAGECQCPQCSTGDCALWYADRDDDGYGDKTATIANGRAKYACADLPQPGFSKNNRDCLDDNTAIAASVHPGATGWYAEGYLLPSGGRSFDYDCNGVESKEIDENGDFRCVFCRNPSGEPQCKKMNTCGSAGKKAGRACGGSNGCSAIDQPFFKRTVACGTMNNVVNCQPCTEKDGTSEEKTSSRTQRCR